ncbi:cytochrome P450 [Pseudomonas sp. NPDC007930]|uniref:cytochrome P450 n=1 Tax=Pseudomonas sp. NPDC007930 TaxID=3364417 RepID=UPI0036E74CA9
MTRHFPSVLSIPNLDAAPYYQVLDSDGPHQQIRLPSGHVATHLTGYHDCRSFLADPSISRTLCNVEGGPTFLPGSTQPELLLNLDNPAHARARATVTRAFSKRGIENLRQHVQHTTERNLQRMRRGELPPDLFASVLQDLTASTVCHILGIPLEDRALFRPWSQIIQAAPPDDLPGIEVAVKASFDYLMDFVRGVRPAEEDGFIRQYVAQRPSLDNPLNDEEFVGVLLGILLGGDHNALSVMTKAIYTLLCAPALWAHAQQHPEQQPALLEELIRLIPIGKLSAFPRLTTQPVLTRRGEIPAGTCVYANVFLANRDPEVFSHPLTINPLREEKAGHLQFGHGIHSCMGPALARLEMTIVLKALTEQLPELQLDRAPESLAWIDGTVLRRPNELPVRF